MNLAFILAGILIFGVLIAVHELGHFAAAKLCGVRVNEFSIGMGPVIFQRERGETLYSLRLLPVGGFCALEGEDEDTNDERAFVRQGFWKKFLVLVAGSGMNFVAGIVIVACLFGSAQGFYVDKIVGFAEGFPHEGENGLMVGDIIHKVDGYRAYLYGDAAMFLQYNDGDGIDLELIRNGEKIVLKDFPMYRATYDGQEGRFGLSVGVHMVEGTFLTRVQYIWYQTLDFVQQTWFGLVQLIRGSVGMSELSGPVGLVSTMTEVGSAAQESGGVVAAVWNLAYIAALLAVNLGVMNLLPIPALDGGRVFFLVLDAMCLLIFRRKIPEKYQAFINAAGFVIIMGFMLLVTFQDVIKLF